MLNIKKVLELNRNLHYITDEGLVQTEFKKFSEEGEVFKSLEKENLYNEDYKYRLPYSLENYSLINEIQKKIIPNFVFSIYEVYRGETSVEIADIYGVSGGDAGQTVSLVLNGKNGLIQYLENNNYYINGFSEKTITVDTEKYLKLSKKLESFGLMKFNNIFHSDAYITQESIDQEKSNKRIKIK